MGEGYLPTRGMGKARARDSLGHDPREEIDGP